MRRLDNTSSKHRGFIVDSKEGIDILECETCGYKHIFPLPSLQELHKFYQEDYYKKEKPRYLQEGEEDLLWWKATYREYYNLLSDHLKKSGEVFEIGSGPGYFLKCGKELGWKVLGVEPSLQAVEYAKQLGVEEVIHGFFTSELAASLSSFDAIFMDMVIEHVIDPAELLLLAKSVLKKEGLILISSPNDYNPLQAILRNTLKFSPWWVVPHHHINYFDFTSIQRLLETLGFEIVELRGSFPMEFFLLGGENYIGNFPLGRKVHGIRKQFESHLYEAHPNLLREFFRFFAKQGIGRGFVVLARNK